MPRISKAARQTISQLWAPGWAEWGAEPDTAARIAEMGPGYESCGATGECEEWEFQRHVPARMTDGRVRIFHYEGRGHLEPPECVGHEDHGKRCRCRWCQVA